MATEQLTMPFDCHVVGGRVSLAPSAPQTYQIYGERERKQLTTCSPFDPRKCHSWYVHRFDLDCGGVRTSWQSVVTALSPILAESLGPAYDAYNEPTRGPARQGPAISFPRGFAPNPMKVAKFEQTGPAMAAPLPADMPLPPKKPEPTEQEQVAALEPAPEPAAPVKADAKAEAASKTPPPNAKEPPEQQALQIEIESEATGSLPKSGSLWLNASTLFQLTLALLFALTATLFLGRRRMLALPLPVPFVQLPHRPAKAGPLARRAHPDPEGIAAEEQEDAPASRLRLWDEDWLPRTMSEALDVLGVDPDASMDKMKTTVTRLRRALHPDYALDEEDRRLRERRLKQINVAWEIVSGKRHSIWLSVKPRAS
jgi:hypothetical protein